MSAALIASLLATFGPSAINLITQLITQIENKQDVTAAQWATLAVSLNQTAQQQMLAQLKAAGIDSASPQGVALLALTK